MESKSEIIQSCLTLCDPMGYTVPRILQARILEWVAVPVSRGSPHPRIEPMSPALQVDSLPAELPGKPSEMPYSYPHLFTQILPILTDRYSPLCPHLSAL